jgi:hypothetical protein
MNDELDRRLKAWSAPPPDSSLDQRMRHLFDAPPPQQRRPPARWPVMAAVAGVASLVWLVWSPAPGPVATVLHQEVQVLPPRHGTTAVSEAADSGPVQLVTRMRLDDYVPVRDARVSVERRTR